MAKREGSKSKGSRANYGVSAEQFVSSWEAAASAADVASQLNMPVAIVHARATYYKRRGVKLKPMPRVISVSAKKAEVDRLNNLAQRIRYAKAEAEKGNSEQIRILLEEGKLNPVVADVLMAIVKAAKNNNSENT